jgi:hypothetical protein
VANFLSCGAYVAGQWLAHATHCAEFLSPLLRRRRGRLPHARAVTSRIGQAHTDPAVAVALVAVRSSLGDVASALSYFHLLN